MRVLGIETATLVSSVALVEDQRVVAEYTLNTGKPHSERLMPAIAEIIAAAGLTPGEIELVAVSRGPGSFTGLRIGITTAKSLAYALRIPVIGVPSLDALAWQLPGEELVCPVFDAQRGNVYNALYRVTLQGLERLSPYRVSEFAALLDELAAGDHPVVLQGDAVELYADTIARFRERGVRTAPVFARMPRAATVAALGGQLWATGVRDDTLLLAPFYIRRSEAEVLWEKRHGQGA